MAAAKTLPKIYLAGPDVFEREPLEVARSKKAICEQYGLCGVFPLDAELSLDGLSKREQGHAISQANEALIRKCAGLLANMTPFRGPSMDVGTAFEIGFARALGLPIVGYTDRAELLHARTRACLGDQALGERSPGCWEDDRGWAIEDFDCVDNLMLDGAAAASGGVVVCPRSGETEDSVFQRAVEQLAFVLLGSR